MSAKKAARRKSSPRLKAYREKRDFSRTKEPRPKIGKGKGWQFVVQKHDARRLHFDLRLELNGVLKSWAVTRGPSLVPEEKRLAIQTEDHPMDYLEWEGVIPKGEYGGGTMIVWDRGTWAPIGDPEFGLKKGHLEFTLDGERLHGRWHLVRMQRKSGEKKHPWLLIKAKDEFARSPGESEIVAEETTSTLSGRTNDELESAGTVRADHAARAKVKKAPLPNPVKLRGAKKGILRPFVDPTLASNADEVPSGGKWLHEIKYDGYRIQARIDGGKVELLTRKSLDWAHRFRTIAAAVKRLPVGAALIDGEIVSVQENGLSSFAGLQADLKSGRVDRLAYMVFDLLYLEGVDLRGVALIDRKTMLREIVDALPGQSVIRYSDHMEGDGPNIFTHACRMGLEGLISKRADRPYTSGRGDDWIKSKCALSQELVIIGFVPSTATKNAIGSLVLGYYDDGKLVHAGRAGTGYSAEQAVELRRMLDPTITTKPKFTKKLEPLAEKGVKWVKPDRVAEIEFRGWTEDGLVRQAAFKGLREDKSPKEIRREAVPGPPEPKRPAVHVNLTHPERILWPDTGLTKQGLADFYVSIAKWILPHVTGRVLSLVRCPSGVGKDCFYAKHRWAGAPSSLRHIDVGDRDPMMAIDDLEGLIALVQSGVLEIHPWGSRIDDLERPDRIIFDLDPGPGVSWPDVIEAAKDVRSRLKKTKLRSFVKTSGGKGLHVVVPFMPQDDWDTVKEFTRLFAEKMAEDEPDRYIAKATKSSRHGRIFVDYLRNGRGATAVAAYSTRARPGAAVSTPISWDELSDAIGPSHFTVDNLPQRLDHLDADPWAEMTKLKQKLPRI